ncbi:MAG: phage/plasmid primase, P4 family [Clostridia bacterium]|nr:phage/plasmid primase, P4 family [Clostridia bacterium]
MEWFTSEHPLICMGGCFYDVDGRIETGRLRRLIAESIRPYINRDCSQQISKIIATMTDFLDSDEYEPEEGWLFFANGDYCISEKMLYPKNKICFNRLPVNYIESASEAEVTMKFLSELLASDDIRTLQEFFGYMFLPSNPGQKMLMILGEGGEGKSQVGEMVKALFGTNCITGSIADLSSNRFMAAMLECKNVFLDDDMKLTALKDTDLLKKLITNSGRMMLEKKNQQPHQGYIYAKLIAFGNGSLKSLYDKSKGFYRRQIVLSALPVSPERKTDPQLGRKIAKEAEGILLWALEGLHRLIDNNYAFTVSDSAKRNLEKIMEEEDTIGAFLNSKGYIELRSDGQSSTKALYNAYMQFCSNNNIKAVSSTTFNGYLSENEAKLGIRYTKHIKGLMGLESRGYQGITVRLDYDQDMEWENGAQDKYYE